MQRPASSKMDEDYESLGGRSSVGAQMTAGGIAGIVEHCTMYPLDSVKTRMQSLCPLETSKGGSGPFSTLFEMMRREGMMRPFRGISLMALGAGPAHAAYFSTYEQIKKGLKSKFATSKSEPFVHGTAGCFATVLHDAIMTPADAVKQRMQMANSGFSSSMQCIRAMYGVEGTRAFYRSYTTQLSMNVPFQSIHFIVYELMQDLSNKERKYSPAAHLLSGGMAGAVAAAVTTPLDVCKTLLNTQDSGTLKLLGKPQIRGLYGAGLMVFKVGGARGFFRGMSARVLTQVPATALSWSVYELFKFLLEKDATKGPSTLSPSRPLQS